MIKNSVCVFASSCNFLDKSYYEAAAELGGLLAKNNLTMVYGGSKLGLMWACAGALKQNGGRLIGVMPEKLSDCGLSAKICDEFYETAGMRERKAKMDELSDSVIALPGGFGTLEEVCEMIVQKQLCYSNKPIVFLNTNNFYEKLREFMDTIFEQKFASEKNRDLYFIAKTPTEAVDYILSYNAPAQTFVYKHYCDEQGQESDAFVTS